MSLRWKFGLMLGALGAIVALSLGAALSIGVFLERELAGPFQATTRVLGELAALDHVIEAQDTVLERSLTDAADAQSSLARSAAEYESLRSRAAHAIAAIEQNPRFRKLAGVSATRSLMAQSQDAANLAAAWFSSGALEDGRAAHGAHKQIRDFIELMNLRVLEEASSAIGYGQELRRVHQTVLWAGIASAALAAFLGVILFGRWVLRPIDDLRLAALRIAAGDYAYRTPIRADDEFGRLSAEINRMAQMVAEAQQEAVERERLTAAGALVRRLAHNLRNPLAAIRSLAELTRRRAADNDQIRKDQSEIVAAVDRFNDWLTELLHANAPLEIECAEINPAEWWERVLASQRPLARMRSAHLVPDLQEIPRPVRVDARRLEHAIVVLITNAIQASPPGGSVGVRSRFLPRDAQWEIEITDQGPGIPDDLKEKIFHPYFTTKPDGNGIGLAIARQVVVSHRGSIAALDHESGGARFVVRIPLADSEPEVGG